MNFPAWAETVEGPILQALLRRLTDCPADFLAEPLLAGQGMIEVGAVVSDLLVELGAVPLTSDTARPFEAALAGENKAVARNRLRCVMVASWLLYDEWFITHRPGPPVLPLLSDGLTAMAALVTADLFVADPDRREELVRTCLFGLALRPAGESVARAEDRLTTLSTAERARVVQATRVAEARARQIREELARKAAEEAAAAYSHE